MIKPYVIILLISISSLLQAQNTIKQIESLMSENKLSQARPLVDKILLEQGNNPKLLLYKGIIIQDQVEVSTPCHTKKIILDSAFYFYKKALEFDTQNTLESIIAEDLQFIAKQYSFTGMELFNEGEYSLALNTFETAIKTFSLTPVNQFDTILWYNAAITADKLNDFNKSRKYYSLIIQNNPTDWNSVVELANTYKKQGQAERYYSIIEKAHNEHPEIILFYKELIGYQLEKQEYDLALKYLDTLLEKDIFDEQLYFLKGSILQEQGKIKESNIQYLKCIELNPNHLDANYNLAVNEYNQAIDLLKKKKITASEKKQIDQYLRHTLTYLEVVKKQEARNKYVLSMLMTCYQELNMQKEKEELEAKLKEEKEKADNEKEELAKIWREELEQERNKPWWRKIFS